MSHPVGRVRLARTGRAHWLTTLRSVPRSRASLRRSPSGPPLPTYSSSPDPRREHRSARRPDLHNSLLVDGADPRAWFAGPLHDSVDVRNESVALFLPSEAAIRETEDAHPVLGHGRQLCGSAPDRVVLRQHDPPSTACERDPLLIADALGALFAVMRCERPRHESCISDRRRQQQPAEAAIDEELRKVRLRSGATHGSRLRRRMGADQNPSPTRGSARLLGSGRGHHPSARRRG